MYVHTHVYVSSTYVQYACTYVYGICINVHVYINMLIMVYVVPDRVDNINILCGAVDLINQCNVTWNVSLYNYCLYLITIR